MNIYRTETTVSTKGTVTLTGLPFGPGEHVEVTVCSRKNETSQGGQYPLRGQPVQYTDPLEGVAQQDWEVFQ